MEAGHVAAEWLLESESSRRRSWGGGGRQGLILKKARVGGHGPADTTAHMACVTASGGIAASWKCFRVLVNGVAR
jgi:hypothetical protein